MFIFILKSLFLAKIKTALFINMFIFTLFKISMGSDVEDIQKPYPMETEANCNKTVMCYSDSVPYCGYNEGNGMKKIFLGDCELETHNVCAEDYNYYRILPNDKCFAILRRTSWGNSRCIEWCGYDLDPVCAYDVTSQIYRRYFNACYLRRHRCYNPHKQLFDMDRDVCNLHVKDPYNLSDLIDEHNVQAIKLLGFEEKKQLYVPMEKIALGTYLPLVYKQRM